MATKTARKRRRQERRLRGMSLAQRAGYGLGRHFSPGRLAVLGIAAGVIVAGIFFVQTLGGARGEPAKIVYPARNPTNENLTVGPREGNLAPNFEATDRFGRRIRLSDFQGKIVMLNFYASWCTPCAKEIPAIDRVYQQYAHQGFEVIGVNLRERKRDAFGFLEALGVTYNAVLDPTGAIADRYGVQGPPVSIFVDRDGVIRHYLPGELRASQVERIVTAMNTGSPAGEDIVPVGTPVIRPAESGG
jgi:cytochrome c biogenesis protein CcmG/thiol:disulfide interchange protein DsbE